MSPIRSAVAHPVIAKTAVMTGALMLGVPAFAAGAQASTIYTYSFTQTGYHDYTHTQSGTVTGTFSAKSNGIDYIYQPALTDFSFTFTVVNPLIPITSIDHWSLSELTAFSYEPGSDSTFQIRTQASFDGICIGQPAALGLCGGAGNNYNGVDATGNPANAAVLFTTDPAQVTLTSIATTPIPAALPLFATSLGGLAALGLFFRRRKRTGASAA